MAVLEICCSFFFCFLFFSIILSLTNLGCLISVSTFNTQGDQAEATQTECKEVRLTLKKLRFQMCIIIGMLYVAIVLVVAIIMKFKDFILLSLFFLLSTESLLPLGM